MTEELKYDEQAVEDIFGVEDVVEVPPPTYEEAVDAMCEFGSHLARFPWVKCTKKKNNYPLWYCETCKFRTGEAVDMDDYPEAEKRLAGKPCKGCTN